MPSTTITPPRVPLTDPQTGSISREWYRYFFSQFNLTGGAALTKTDDTNVTLNLGGTPATALLKATSLTLGWSGFLGKARGGTAEDNSIGGTANTFWARPNGATGAATYRAIVAADIPNLSATYVAVSAIGTQVPSPTGAGASGTWGISITGTAAGAPPTGAAGGNLGGTYPNPSIASLPAISGALLTNLTPANISAGTAGINITGNAATVTNGVYTSRLINTTLPLSGGGDLSTDRTLSISQAGVATNGYLSSIDWNTFNNKGSVSSVGLSLPVSIFSISGSPVTGSGTLTGTFINQTANQLFAGPVSGVPGIPGFRALVAADIPNLDTSKLTTGQLGVARGGTGSDLSATGGASQYLKQLGVGLAISVGTISPGDITGAALTKADDTNVTMTFGGNPTVCLLTAVSMTLGWTGQLSLTRGGTNANLTAVNGGVVYSTAGALAIGLAGVSGDLLTSAGAAPYTWSTPVSTATINAICKRDASGGLAVAALTATNATLSNGLSIHSMTLPVGETVTIPADYQAVTFGTFTIDGILIVNGEYRVEN